MNLNSKKIFMILIIVIGLLVYVDYRITVPNIDNAVIQNIAGIQIRDDYYAKRPFAEVDIRDIKNINALYGTYEPIALSESEKMKFLLLIKDIIIYQVHTPKDRLDELIGSNPSTFQIEMTNGDSFNIASDGQTILINDTRYYAENTPSKNLTEFHRPFKDKILAVNGK